MNSSIRHELNEDYLLVIGEGESINPTEIMEGTRFLHHLIVKYESRLVLIDYRKVYYDVPLTEAFNLVRTYEREMPEFKNISMAAVVNPESAEISQFWKSIGKKRNFNFEVFEDKDEAETWLLKQKGIFTE